MLIGTEQIIPMFEALSISIIAGLTFSSLFTLVMSPPLYVVFTTSATERKKLHNRNQRITLGYAFFSFHTG